MRLWIDDFRTPEGDGYAICRTAEDAITLLEREEPRSLRLYLDHDLGEGMSGYDFCKWFVEKHLDDDYDMRFHLLTANPVGAYNMRQLLVRYGYVEF